VLIYELLLFSITWTHMLENTILLQNHFEKDKMNL